MITLSSTEVQQNFGYCLNHVSTESIVITKFEKPVAILISMDEYNTLTGVENNILLEKAKTSAQNKFLSDQESSIWFKNMDAAFTII